jgi:predicted metal-dependent HD superfamily phosphohydrolase
MKYRDDAPLALPPAQWQALEAAYATPNRAYHHLGHVEDVLNRYVEVAAGPGWAQPAEVYLAMLYHDAVYDPARRDNEARSAALAQEHIRQWLPDAGIDAARVAALIEVTAEHGRLAVGDVARDPQAADLAHFLDADMAILGASADAFDAYHRGIAAEYRAHVPAWLFQLNRRRFLKALLSRERIFLSDFFHARLDTRARHNLRRAITEKR